jgi:hypothetical protein
MFCKYCLQTCDLPFHFLNSLLKKCYHFFFYALWGLFFVYVPCFTNLCLILNHWDFFPIFKKKIYSFNSYIYIYGMFLCNFCIWNEEKIKASFFCHMVPNFSNLIYWKDYPFYISIIALAYLLKINWSHICRSISRISVLYHWSLPLHQYHTVLITVALIVSLIIR